MRLRPYQKKAVAGIVEQFAAAQSTLLVMATGLGKTVIFADLIRKYVERGRVMVLAHRDELIRQAADKIRAVAGEWCDIEKAEQWADMSDRFDGPTRVIVSSIQTQVSGGNGKGRMARFDPRDFSLLIIDESHHAVAETYRRTIAHYKQNPDLKILGVTATPDRHDEAALGQIFQTVAMEYWIHDAIRDGWLVPVESRPIRILGLDFSRARTTAGDLNGADLEQAVTEEKPLHGMTMATFEAAYGLPDHTLNPIIDEADERGVPLHSLVEPVTANLRPRRTLFFAASIRHAELITTILNRYLPNCARLVTGETPAEERRHILWDYNNDQFPVLINVDVATEGFDSPGISLVCMGRATKSRAKYVQMLGRGTRVLPGIIDDLYDPDGQGLLAFEEHDDIRALRRKRISESVKPSLEVLDFVGNCGRHEIVTAIDVLGGEYSDEVVAEAKKIAAEKGEKRNIGEQIREAEESLRRRREEEARRRVGIVAKAEYQKGRIDIFGALKISHAREPAWHRGRAPSAKMKNLLLRFGIDDDQVEKLSFVDAHKLIDALIERRKSGKCSWKQARLLMRRGLPGDVSFEEARAMIDGFSAREGWGNRRGGEC